VKAEADMWTSRSANLEARSADLGHFQVGPTFEGLCSCIFYILLHFMPPWNMLFSLMFIHFSIYFLITSYRNTDSPKPVKFYQLNPYFTFLSIIYPFSCFIDGLKLMVDDRQQLLNDEGIETTHTWNTDNLRRFYP
jgi:hypothetical protein